MSSGQPSPPFVIAATGLVVEARIALKAGRVRAVAGGGSTSRLTALIEEQVADGALGIISFGIAGGLQEGLQPGASLVGSEVVHGAERHRADEVWLAAIQAKLDSFPHEQSKMVESPSPLWGGARGGGNPDFGRSAIPPSLALPHEGGGNHPPILFAGVDHPVATPSEKRALAEATGAAAVDMESHIVARVAAKHRLPFAVLRVVADSVDRGLPPAALVGMRPDGSTDVGACLRSLAREPRQLPDLIRVALDARRAMATLLRCVELLGPGLGLRDLG